MPLYEYECPKCKGKIEMLQHWGGEITICARCGVKMERLISMPALITIKKNHPTEMPYMGGNYSEYEF